MANERRDSLGRKIPQFDRSEAGKKSAKTAKERYGKDYHKKLAVKGGSKKTRGYLGKLKDEDPKKLMEVATKAIRQRKWRPVKDDKKNNPPQIIKDQEIW